MNRKFDLTAVKTYASEKNAERAVEKAGFDDLRHFITWTQEGRCFPVFIGQEALSRGVHFHFNVVG